MQIEINDINDIIQMAILLGAKMENNYQFGDSIFLANRITRILKDKGLDRKYKFDKVENKIVKAE